MAISDINKLSTIRDTVEIRFTYSFIELNNGKVNIAWKNYDTNYSRVKSYSVVWLLKESFQLKNWTDMKLK